MKIVVGVDGSERQLDALALTRTLAGIEAGSEVVIVHVHPIGAVVEVWDELYEELALAGAKDVLEQATDLVGFPCRGRLVCDGSAASGLHRVLVEENADLLVLGPTHRGAAGRAVFGSVAESVVHGAPCAVAFASAGYAECEHELRRFGVGYDAGAESRAALTWAERLARSCHGELTLYRVREQLRVALYPGLAALDGSWLYDEVVAEQQRELDEAVAAVAPGLPARGELLDAPIGEALATATSEQDVFVVGSRGYGHLGNVFLGGISQALVRHAVCPVVVLPRSVRTSHPAAPTSAAGSVTTP